jgi:hypothetical protein
VADEGNNVIRRLERNPSGGFFVTTFQGTRGSIGFAEDTDNNPLTLGATFDEPSGLALFGNYLFVSDADTKLIRRIDLTTRNTVRIAGSPNTQQQVDGTGGSARFCTPQYLAVDGAGVVYVSDFDIDHPYGSFTGLVRKITGATTLIPSAQVTTLAGDIVQRRRAVRPGPLPGILNQVKALTLAPNGDMAVASENSILFIR